MENIPKSNQIKIIITFILVAIIITLIVLYKDQLFKLNNNMTDSEKFYTEYNGVPVNNVYKYTTAKEAIELFKSDLAIIFFGFKECKWCQSYVPMLDQYAKQNNINTIYYVDIKEDRANNTQEYKELVQLLNKYLADDENGNKRIYVPDVYFVQEGKIIGHNNDTSMEEGADTQTYYDEHGNELKEKISGLFNKINVTCDDTGKGC